MKKLLAILALFAMAVPSAMLAPAQAAPDCAKGNTGKAIGAVAGGVLGGLLGRKIDGGKNRTAGTLIGGVAGAIVGAQIGKALDKCEQQKVADTTVAALDGPPNKEFTQSWTSETREDVNGKVTASPSQKLPDGRVCRMATRVNYVDGEEIHDSPMFCKKPPSTAWVAT